MLDIRIPGFGHLKLNHLVLDYNGTIAADGLLIPGVAERLGQLAQSIGVHVLTADTFGGVREQLDGVPCIVAVIAQGGENGEDQAKLDYVRSLGAESCACLGNGRNDRLMLEAAALGVCVLGGEGVNSGTLAVADMVCRDILDGLDLLIRPLRLVAGLRC